MENSILIKLKPKFQKELFSNITKRFGSSKKASLVLNIPPSSIRAYKNLRFNYVSKTMIYKLLQEGITNKEEISQNTVSMKKKEDILNKNLGLGRKARKTQLNEWQKAIPKLNEIIQNNKLDLEEWFKNYKRLIDFGSRRFNYIKREDNFLEISYITHSNKVKKEFVVYLPRKIELDDNFIYFLGLWCGDKAGGKRFGVCNQNKDILKFVESFLINYKQRIEKVLYISSSLEVPKVEYDKIVRINKETKGWAISVHSTNGILSSFFGYLRDNLDILLPIISKKTDVFFGGLFDAEGNVSLYNQSIRIACRNERLTNIYLTFLKEINLDPKYDGQCIISYNINQFYSKIYPHLRHNEKINLMNLLKNGEGSWPEGYKRILRILQKNPKMTQREISKGLKRNKVYSELTLLTKFKLVSFEGYPHRFKITEKGVKV